MRTKSNDDVPEEARVQFRTQVLQYVQYESVAYRTVYAKGLKIFAGYIRGELERYIKQKALKEKTPSKSNLTNFFDPDREHQPYTRICNLLCQLFWDETIKEWYEKEYAKPDDDANSEYVVHKNWSGIVLHYKTYQPERVVHDTNKRFEDLLRNNKLTTSKKEVWFYGTHFYYSLSSHYYGDYLNLLEHGASLKFFINRLDYNGSSLALDFKATMFGTDKKDVYNESHDGIEYLVSLMKKWRDKQYEDATFYETYASQIEIKLHNRVPGYRGYFLCPDCPGAISVVFPSIDGEISLKQTGWIGDNRPDGLVMQHFDKLSPFWEDSKHHITFQDFLQEGENHNYYKDYPELLADYFNC